jgi:hypothetical protein
MSMDIRLVSSFDHDDEDRFAASVLRSMCDMLNALPVAYCLRIETEAGTLFQHNGDGTGVAAFRPDSALESRKREIARR